MTLSSGAAQELADALDRFDAKKLSEALDRNTEVSKALAQSIDRLVNAFELLERSQPAQNQAQKPER